MILIFTDETTQRVNYTFKMVFTNFMNTKIEITSDKNFFNTYKGHKISYSKNKIKDELFFYSSDILFQNKISNLNIEVSSWKKIKIFFHTNETGSLPFDIFACIFYMLSRYEEYLPHIKDNHKRFPAKNSLAFKNGFLKLPIVELWINELKLLIESFYPDFKFPQRKFNHINTIDVDHAFLFKEIGFFRGIWKLFKSFVKFDFEKIKLQLNVLTNKLYDPYDNFDYLLKISKKYNIEFIYFFLLADFSKYDRNIPFYNKKFIELIQSTSDYFNVGIHFSYNSNHSIYTKKKELDRLSNIVRRKIKKSRQHFLKLNLPLTYQNLIKLGIKEDYSMGYASHFGFRAGTSLPYYFYDLENEKETDLLIKPFVIMDGTLNNYLKLNVEEAKYSIKNIISTLKKVNGNYISIWHNHSLCDMDEWKGWKDIFEFSIKELSK